MSIPEIVAKLTAMRSSLDATATELEEEYGGPGESPFADGSRQDVAACDELLKALGSLESEHQSERGRRSREAARLAYLHAAEVVRAINGSASSAVEALTALADSYGSAT